MRKDSKSITITEDMKLPGTDVILEKGDAIMINLNEGKFDKKADRIRVLISDIVEGLRDVYSSRDLIVQAIEDGVNEGTFFRDEKKIDELLQSISISLRK